MHLRRKGGLKFSKQMQGKIGQPTILNTLTITGVCSGCKGRLTFRNQVGVRISNSC